MQSENRKLQGANRNTRPISACGLSAATHFPPVLERFRQENEYLVPMLARSLQEVWASLQNIRMMSHEKHIL